MKNKFTIYSLLSSIVLGFLFLTLTIVFIGDFVDFIRLLSNSSLLGGQLAGYIINVILDMVACGLIIFLGVLEIKKLLKEENNNNKIVFRSLGIFLTVLPIEIFINAIVGYADAGIIVLAVFTLLVGLFSLLLGFFTLNLKDQVKVITNFVALGLEFIFVIVLLATVFSGGISITAGVFFIFILIITITINVLEFVNKNALNYVLNITPDSSKKEETKEPKEEQEVESKKEIEKPTVEETKETTESTEEIKE